MADITLRQDGQLPIATQVRYRDMGDGTHALVASVAVETGGATQYQEDAPSASGDLGTMALAVRNDAGGSLVSANGDYAPLQVNAAGQLIIAGGAGGTSMADDAPFAPGATQITPMGAMLDDVAPDTVNEGDAGIPRMSANRNLYTQIRDNAGNERGLNVDAGGRLGANAHDGAGTALTSTLVGADQALDVNIVAGAGAGGTSMVDDAAFTPATTAITPAGAMFDDVAPDSVDEGDAGVVRMSANRNLYSTIRDAAGNERGLNVDAAGAIAVTDGGGALTVDNAVLSVVGGGAEATAQRVTIANDSTGLVSVDDAGGSLTVDGGVTADIRDGGGVALTSTLVGADQALDVNIVQTVGGAGGTSMVDDAAFTPATTQITPMGAMLDDTAPDSVDEGDAGVVRMSANRNLHTTLRDAAGNERGLNVDANNRIGVTNPVLSVVGGGTEAAAQRVTIANDSTGVLSVDDNAGSLTVDQATHDNLNANANIQVGDADVANGNPVPISDAGGSITIDGTVAIQEPLSVDDNGGSLTVDNAVLSVVGGGTEAVAQRVTIANDSTGVLSVDDGGSALTVDGAGTSMVDNAVFTPATTPVTPIAGFCDDTAPDSVAEGDAGAVRMSANRNLYTRIRDADGNERGLKVDANGLIGVTNTILGVVGGGTEATAQRVTIANDSTGVLSVDDGGAALSVDDDGGSLTVDNAALSVVGGGTEAAAQRVTIANDSTGVLSVDDNDGSLTVDNAVLSVVGGGTEAAAMRVTIANDSTGLVSVDDGGGTLTVDGGVTADMRDGAGNALTSTLVVADQALDVNIVQTVGGAGGTSITDDAAFTPATTQVTPIAGFCDETAPDSVDEGDAGAVRMSANRNLHTVLRDAAGNERGLNVDASGDIGITNAALAIIGGGVEAAALRVTVANDSTGLLSVDDNDGSLTVDQNYHDNLLCNANMQVGDADVAAGNPVPVGVRDGAGTALTSTLVGADQALDVNIVAGAGAGGTSMVDDAAFTPATTAITPAGAMFDDVAPDSVDEGDAGVVRMSANRNLYVTLRDAAGNERGLNVDASNNIGVTNSVLSVVGGGTEATAQRVTIANDSTGVLSVDDNDASLTVDNAALSVVGGGTEATALRVTIANDSTGVLTVDDGGGALTVDGTVTVQDGGGSLTVDNAVLSVVGAGTEAAAQRVTIANDSTGVLSVDDNNASLTVDNAALSLVGGGAEATALRVTIANDSTGLVSVDDGGAALSVDDAGGSLTVDNPALSVVGAGTEAAAQRVTIANDSTGVLSVDDNAGSLTVDNPVLSVVGGGAEATAQRVTIANDSTGLVSVDDGGGTLTVDGTVTASNTAGDTAHDAVDAGNPVKLGARAIETDGTDPGEVAEADRTDLKADMNGRLLVNTGHPNAWKTNNNYAAAQTDTELKAAPGANLSFYITAVILSTEEAQNIRIVSDTAGGPSTLELGPFYFADNGGMVAMTFEPAIRIAANTNVGVTSSGAVNHTITLNGYIAP